MSYFDLYMIGAWSFGLGWSVAAIYLQNRVEEEKRTPEPKRAVTTKPAARLPTGIATSSSG